MSISTTRFTTDIIFAVSSIIEIVYNLYLYFRLKKYGENKVGMVIAGCYMLFGMYSSGKFSADEFCLKKLDVIEPQGFVAHQDLLLGHWPKG